MHQVRWHGVPGDVTWGGRDPTAEEAAAAWRRSCLEGHAGDLREHLFRVYLPFDHVGVDVHVHACILAQLEQGSNVVFGQPQVSA